MVLLQFVVEKARGKFVVGRSGGSAIFAPHLVCVGRRSIHHLAWPQRRRRIPSAVHPGAILESCWRSWPRRWPCFITGVFSLRRSFFPTTALWVPWPRSPPTRGT